MLDERVTDQLHGLYRDVLRDASGRVVWDRGWHKNAIVTDCRRLLATFMHRPPPAATGIGGLWVGAGLAAWDAPPGPPLATAAQTALVDLFRFEVPPANLQITFLDPATGTISANPTSKLQIFAQLGPGVPSWPDANHPTITLREFGLFGTLGATKVLINYVTHPAIVKDPTSTLERTIWLVF
jgi:hypothetical protein